MATSSASAAAVASANRSEAAHYVATNQAAGSVLMTARCTFLGPNTTDLAIVKSRRLEIRQLTSDGDVNTNADADADADASKTKPAATTSDADGGDEGPTSAFPLLLSVPLNARLTTLLPFRHPSSPTDYLFFTTERKQFGILGYDTSAGHAHSAALHCPYRTITHGSGALDDYGASVLGREAETGPLASIDPQGRCIAVHLYDGFVTILPILPEYSLAESGSVGGGAGLGGSASAFASSDKDVSSPNSSASNRRSSILGTPFNIRIEERTVLSMSFLYVASPNVMPQLCLLHQDAKSCQHIIAHSIDLGRRNIISQSDASSVIGSSSGKAGAVRSVSSWTKGERVPNTSLLPPPITDRLRKSRIDGGSGIAIPVPPCVKGYEVPRIPGSDIIPSAASGVSSTKGIQDNEDDRKLPADGSGTSSGATGGSSGGKSGTGGILIFGQRQITYHSTADGITKVLPISQGLVMAVDLIIAPKVGCSDKRVELASRYLIAMDDSALHIVTVLRSATSGKVTSLHMEALGPTALASAVSYLGRGGMIFVGSQFGDSALLQVLERPIPIVALDGTGATEGTMAATTTYLSTVEEYTNLGPIVDFDLIPTAHSSLPTDSSSSDAALEKNRQSMVVTASGLGSSGSLRLVRSGIGLTESASINLPGIKGMWNLRGKYSDVGNDKFLVQSYVGETRVLGVVNEEDEDDGGGEEVCMQEDEDCNDISQDASQGEDEEWGGATLAEVEIQGFDSHHSTLFASNIYPYERSSPYKAICSDTLAVQVTDHEVRLVNLSEEANSEALLDLYRPESDITIAAGNEAGQIILALRGGSIVSLSVIAQDDKIGLECNGSTVLETEISCLDVRPFDSKTDGSKGLDIATEMELDTDAATAMPTFRPKRSSLVAVGLWDDFSVRLLSLDNTMSPSYLSEVLRIPLGTESLASAPHIMDIDGEDSEMGTGVEAPSGNAVRGQHMMARSICMITLGSGTQHRTNDGLGTSKRQAHRGVDVLLVGLGDGGLVSFVVSSVGTVYSVHARKEVSLGTRAVGLVPFRSSTALLPADFGNGGNGTCILATGDRPTVIYLAGGSVADPASSGGNGSIIPKLCYSAVHLSSNSSIGESDDPEDGDAAPSAGMTERAGRESLTVSVATPFHSSFFAPDADKNDPASEGNHQQQGAPSTYPLCVSDESTLRLGIIDDIQKLHITNHNIGMTPRRVTYHEASRVICVGAIDGEKSNVSGDKMMAGESNMGNCVRFFDDTSFEELDRLDLDPFEMILSMESIALKVNDGTTSNKSQTSNVVGEDEADENTSKSKANCRSYIIIGTAYAYPDEDEPTRGRVLLIQCGSGGGAADGDQTSMLEGAVTGGSSMPSSLNRTAHIVTEMITKGGVYSICPFYDASILISVNMKTHRCCLFDSANGSLNPELRIVGACHYGHILSLCVQSLVPAHSAASTLQDSERSRLALVADLMRSVSVVQYFPNYNTIEEVARDYNSNWTTAIEMLTDDIYLCSENWSNFYVLRRNSQGQAEEIRCRLDTVGEFNFGEMVNKFLSGSMSGVQTGSGGFGDRDSGGRSGMSGGTSGMRSPKKAKKAAVASGGSNNSPMKAVVTIGSQTLFGTVDGSLGSVLGLDGPTAAFFSALERCMARVIRPVGNLGHSEFRAFVAERRHHPSKGFVDGDFVESFIDLDRVTQERVIVEMNEDGRWEIDDLDENALEKPAATPSSPILTVEDVLSMVEEISMKH